MMIKTAACSEAASLYDIRDIPIDSRFIVTTHFVVRLVLRFWTPDPLRSHLVVLFSITPSLRQLRRSASWGADVKVVSLTTNTIYHCGSPRRMSLYLKYNPGEFIAGTGLNVARGKQVDQVDAFQQG
jgi:hypothetical protein